MTYRISCYKSWINNDVKLCQNIYWKRNGYIFSSESCLGIFKGGGGRPRVNIIAQLIANLLVVIV